MPNWVCNELIITNTENGQVLRDIEELLRSEFRPLDFEKLIPAPKEINESNQWYEWRCQHWNTKTNASLAKLIITSGKLEYSFCTAWAPPVPIIYTITEAFPDQEMEYRYVDLNEAWWQRCCTLLGGKVIKEETKQIGEIPEGVEYLYDSQKDDYVKVEDGVTEDDDDCVFTHVFAPDDLTTEEWEAIDSDAPFDDDDDDTVDLFSDETE